MMAMTPVLYLQQYTAVFVVDRVVVKLYIIEGFNPKQGELARSYMFGANGLVNMAARTVKEWLSGKRKEFVDDNIATVGQPSSGNVPWSDLSRCAQCGVERDSLMRCSRCKKVAYCSRGK